jgi:HEAT repeat protein
MNETLKVIVGVLEAGRPELQVAAAQILGELRSKETAVVRALAASMRRSPVMARFAVDALAKIGTPEAWHTVAHGLLEGEAIAEHVAHLLVEAGAVVQPVLVALYAEAPLEQRVRILGILAKGLRKDSLAPFVQALLTPELTDHALRLLLQAADHFDAGMQKSLRETLLRQLAQPLPDACVGNALQAWAGLDPAEAKPVLVRYLDVEHNPAVRAAAMRALRGMKLAAGTVRSLLELLEDPTMRELHVPAQELLSQLPELPDGLLPVCKRLLASREPEQRLFALQMLRHTGGAELAKLCLKLLTHAEERFRQAARDCLAHNKAAVEPLLRLLGTTKDAALANTATQLLIALRAHLSPKLLRTISDKAVRSLANNTRLGDQLLDVVLSTATAKDVATLIDSAVRLRRARRHAEALHLLARLVTHPLGETEGRYQLAITKLAIDMMRKPGMVEPDQSAPGNATMGYFAVLVRNGFPLAERLRKEPSMTPEALLRLGQHFRDAVGPEQRFGTELLQHLAARTKGRPSEEARVALRTIGA